MFYKKIQTVFFIFKPKCKQRTCFCTRNAVKSLILCQAKHSLLLGQNQTKHMSSLTKLQFLLMCFKLLKISTPFLVQAHKLESNCLDAFLLFLPWKVYFLSTVEFFASIQLCCHSLSASALHQQALALPAVRAALNSHVEQPHYKTCVRQENLLTFYHVLATKLCCQQSQLRLVSEDCLLHCSAVHRGDP